MNIDARLKRLEATTASSSSGIILVHWPDDRWTRAGLSITPEDADRLRAAGAVVLTVDYVADPGGEVLQ